MRRWWLFGAVAALMIAGLQAGGQALAAVGAGPAAGQHGPRALLVCNGSTAPCPRGVPVFRKVQAAVDAARPGD